MNNFLQPGSFAMCPSYSKNRQHVLKTNNLLGVPLTQPFPSMQPGSDSLARSWTRLLSLTRTLLPLLAVSYLGPWFPPFHPCLLPSPPWVGGLQLSEFSASTGPWDLCTGCSSPLKQSLFTQCDSLPLILSSSRFMIPPSPPLTKINPVTDTPTAPGASKRILS